MTTKLQCLLVKLYNFFPFAVAESLLLSAFFGDATSPLMHQTQTVNRGLPGEKKESITSCKENSAFHSHPLRCCGGPLACSSWKEPPKGLAGSLGPRSAKSWPCGGTTSPPLPGCCTRRGCVLRPHQIPRFPLFLALLYSVLSFPFPLPSDPLWAPTASSAAFPARRAFARGRRGEGGTGLREGRRGQLPALRAAPGCSLSPRQ